jgi:hypothetical protein
MENNKSAAEMVDRKEGYYWVSFSGEKWIIAEWGGERYWWIFGNEEPFCDIDFEEIDERQICRS